jgi:hypothetical protein
MMQVKHQLGRIMGCCCAMLMSFFGLAVFPSHTDADEQTQIAQTAPVPYRAENLLIAFVPDSFSFLPFDEYEDFGIRGVAATLEDWSGLKVKQSNTVPNMIVLRDRGFDAIIESDDPLTQSIMSQVFGGPSYPETARRTIGAEENCFVYNAVTTTSRVTATLVFLDSRLRDWEEAICTVQGMSAAFGVADRALLDNQITLSADTGRIVLGEDLRRAFADIYIF